MGLDLQDIVSLCEGNPGALNVLLQLSNLGNDLKWFGENKVAGPKIWIAYKDLSGSDPVKLLANMKDPTFAKKVLEYER